MNGFKKSFFVKLISTVLTFLFMWNQILWADPSLGRTAQNLAVPLLTQLDPMTPEFTKIKDIVQYESGTAMTILDIAEALFEDRVPFNHLTQDIERRQRKTWGKVLSGIDVSGVASLEALKKSINDKKSEVVLSDVMPENDVIVIPIKNGKEEVTSLILVARTDVIKQEEIPGYVWELSDKYITKILPRGYDDLMVKNKADATKDTKFAEREMDQGNISDTQKDKPADTVIRKNDETGSVRLGLFLVLISPLLAACGKIVVPEAFLDPIVNIFVKFFWEGVILLGTILIFSKIKMPLIFKDIFSIKWYSWRLGSKDWSVRKDAVKTLSEQILFHKHTSIEKKIARETLVAEMLIRALPDKDSRVVERAVQALIKIGSSAVIPLSKEFDATMSSDKKILIKKILIEMGERAEKPLITVLKNKEAYNINTRFTARSILLSLNRESSYEVVAQDLVEAYTYNNGQEIMAPMGLRLPAEVYERAKSSLIDYAKNFGLQNFRQVLKDVFDVKYKEEKIIPAQGYWKEEMIVPHHGPSSEATITAIWDAEMENVWHETVPEKRIPMEFRITLDSKKLENIMAEMYLARFRKKRENDYIVRFADISVIARDKLTELDRMNIIRQKLYKKTYNNGKNVFVVDKLSIPEKEYQNLIKRLDKFVAEGGLFAQVDRIISLCVSVKYEPEKEKTYRSYEEVDIDYTDQLSHSDRHAGPMIEKRMEWVEYSRQISPGYFKASVEMGKLDRLIAEELATIGKKEGLKKDRTTQKIADKEHPNVVPESAYTELFEIVENLINNRRDKIIREGNTIAEYLSDLNGPEEVMPTGQLVRELKKLLETLILTKTKIGKDLPVNISTAEKYVSENVEQLEADSIVGAIISLGREAKNKKENIVIGFDLSWVPEYHLDSSIKNAVSPLVREITGLQMTLEKMGITNVKIVTRNWDSGKGYEDLENWSASITGSLEKEGDYSNVIVFGGLDSIKYFETNVLANISDEKRAFLAGVDASVLDANMLMPGQYWNLSILNLLSVAFEAVNGKDVTSLNMVDGVRSDLSMRKLVLILPEIEARDISEITKQFKRELKALTSA